jgi:hypothetical protein
MRCYVLEEKTGKVVNNKFSADGFQSAIYCPDGLCRLVVLATNPEVPGSIPGATRFSE